MAAIKRSTSGAVKLPSSTPAHVRNLIGNMDEVHGLMELHRQVSGENPGRRFGLEVLNKSAIVLIVACWESFIEELALSAFEFLLANATSYDCFPSKVLVQASAPLRDDQDKRAVWRLAGDGWREVLVNHRKYVVEMRLDKFHSPRCEGVDSLLSELIGFPSLSSTWHWPRSNNTLTKARLEELIDLRGEIAHKVRATRSAYKADVFSARDLVSRLAAISSNRVSIFLKSRTGIRPWGSVGFGRAA